MIAYASTAFVHSRCIDDALKMTRSSPEHEVHPLVDDFMAVLSTSHNVLGCKLGNHHSRRRTHDFGGTLRCYDGTAMHTVAQICETPSQFLGIH